jgi:EAL domain-containing protein (putative c-di-GMP-specific phosphodiesterase class I)
MWWRSALAVALVAFVLLVALPHPNARTAVLLAALLAAAVAVAGTRAVTTGHRITTVLLGIGVLVHGATTVAQQTHLVGNESAAATTLGWLHAASFVLGVACLVVLGLRAVSRSGTALPPAVPGLDDRMLAAELRRAVAHGELSVHYQPIVDARSGHITSVEALVRWEHPTLGMLPPARFLPAAEQADLMVDIGRYVLSVACTDLASWRRRWSHLALAVNVSERELLHPGFAEHVTETLRRHALPAGALHLELTETVAVNEETIAAVLEPLASSGVALSIDDFGTGHSSLHRLNRLRRLRVQRLKIDKSFVDEIEAAGQGAGPLLASMIALAHSVGHSVVAEGVETSDQAAFLARHGCDELQGYLYSRPVPAEQLTMMLPRLSVTSPLQIQV